MSMRKQSEYVVNTQKLFKDQKNKENLKRIYFREDHLKSVPNEFLQIERIK